jgi:hypothetical protein
VDSKLAQGQEAAYGFQWILLGLDRGSVTLWQPVTLLCGNEYFEEQGLHNVLAVHHQTYTKPVSSNVIWHRKILACKKPYQKNSKKSEI